MTPILSRSDAADLVVAARVRRGLSWREIADEIMSAINFRVDVSRRPDPDGDRVVVTFDGKFLDYKLVTPRP
ncbi:hypothetical protein [Kocuria rosea]|uniref:cyanase n=1 Tax=Kocuria rosea TaxID=1275 RepID=UPI00253FDA5A|nr:hypothetical protein [Kocuria rosea]WIG16416.1 hypothetical protein QOY29_12105 [Kocuria rosea]